MKAMLAEEVPAERLPRYVENDDWWMQQKLDGQRLLVSLDDGDVTLLNRNGAPKVTNVPPNLVRVFRDISRGRWVFDGEVIGSTFHVFDLPVALDAVDTSVPYHLRHRALEGVLDTWEPGSVVQIVATARTTDEKARLVAKVRASGGEGLILRRHDHVYAEGRRTLDLLKAKFVKTADCVITRTGVDGKENAELAMFEDGALLTVGKCSLIGKPPVSEGDVVEVKYLYATNDQRLYQPRLVRVRTDKEPVECTTDQLKYVSKELVTL